MSPLDWFIAGIIALGVAIGCMKGAIRQLASIVGFILIGVLVPVVFLFLASVLTRIVDGLRLGWLNRLLGAGLGAIKYVLLLSIAIHCMEFIDSEDNLISSTNKQQSLLYTPVKDSAGYFYPVIKDVTKQLIN